MGWKGLSFPDFGRRFFSSLARKVDTFLFSILDRFTLSHFHAVFIDIIMIWNSMIPFLLFGKNVCPWMGHSFLHRVSDVMAAAFIRPRCSAWQRYAIILIVFYPLWIIFLLPHLFLRSSLEVYHCGYLVSDTHVRPIVIVEVYEPSDDVPGMFQIVEGFSGIYDFGFYNSIRTLRNSIIGRVIILCHADSDTMFPEHCHVIITTILHPPV